MAKIILKGFIEIPDADIHKVTSALPEHIELTLCEPGCLVFSVEPDEQNPNRYNIYEEFADKNAFELHQKRAKESKWGEVTTNVTRNYQIHGL